MSSSLDRPRSEQRAGKVTGTAGLIHVDDGGYGGTPVVFLHSFAGSAAHWSEQLKHVRQTRRALAADLRGHGQSAAPADRDYSASALAADIGALVDQLQLGTIVLVGHSLGGTAALDYAGRHPEHVRALVLVATPGRMPPDRVETLMASMRADYEQVTQNFWTRLLEGARPDVRAQVEGQMRSVPKDHALSLFDAQFAYDPVPALRKYAGATLVISTPNADTANDIQHLVPLVRHQVISGTSHWPHMDKPEEFNRLLDEFLRRI